MIKDYTNIISSCSVVGAKNNLQLHRVRTLLHALNDYTDVKVSYLPGMKNSSIRSTSRGMYARMYNYVMDLALKDILTGKNSLYLESSDEDTKARVSVEWVGIDDEGARFAYERAYKQLDLSRSNYRIPIVRIRLKGGKCYDLISNNLITILSQTCNKTNGTFRGDPAYLEDYKESLRDKYPGFTAAMYNRAMRKCTSVLLSRLSRGYETSILSSNLVLQNVAFMSSDRRKWGKYKEYTDPITIAVKLRKKYNKLIHGTKH